MLAHDELEGLLETVVHREPGREDVARRAALKGLAERAAEASPRRIDARSLRRLGSPVALRDRLSDVKLAVGRSRAEDADSEGILAGLGVRCVAHCAAVHEELVIGGGGEPARRLLQPDDEAVPGGAPLGHAACDVERPYGR